MKKHLLFVAIVFAIFNTHSLQAQSWDNLGTPQISDFNAFHVVMKKAPNDTLYMAYRDFSTNGNGEVTVKKFDGTDWVLVGLQGGTGSQGATDPFILDMDIADNGEIYIAYQSQAAADKRLIVRKLVGNIWADISNNNIVPPTGSFLTQIHIDVEGPLVWVTTVGEDVNYDPFINVNRLESNLWVNYDPFVQTPNAYSRVSLDNGTLAYIDGTFKVRSYSLSGSTWVPLGGGNGYISQSTSGDVNLKGSYATYIDANYQLHVAQYSLAGWVDIGTAIAPFGGFTDFEVVNGEVYVAYVDGQNGDGTDQVRVQHYDGSTWTELTPAVTTANYTGDGDYLSLAIYNGEPVVAVQEWDGGAANPTIATVYTFSSCPIVIDATITYSENTATDEQTLTVPLSQTATYEWVDCDNNYATLAGPGLGANSWTVPDIGNYACIIVDGCATDTSDCYNVDYILGLENAENTQIKVFPNPALNTINVVGAQGSVSIYSISGILVNKTTLSGDTEVDISNLEPGTYLIHFTSANNQGVTRFTKR